MKNTTTLKILYREGSVKSQTNIRQRLIAFASVLLLTACGGGGGGSSSNSSNNSGSGSATANTVYEGVWVSPAYGLALQFRQNRIQQFEYTSDYCMTLLDEQFAVDDLTDEGWQLDNDNASLRQIISFKGTSEKGNQYEKTSDLPQSCNDNRVPITGQPGYTKNVRRDFDIFTQIFQELYLSFDRKGVDWASLYEAELGSISETLSDESFLLTLARIIEPLRDSHVKILAEGTGFASFNHEPTTTEQLAAEFIALNGPVDSEEKQQQYVSYIEDQLETITDIKLGYAVDPNSIKQAANNQLVWFLAPDNIGVLIIQNMYGFSAGFNGNLNDIDTEAELTALDAALDTAFQDLHNTQGLIVDIRANGGGYDTASQLIARRFLDTERHLYSKQARLGESRTPLEPYRLTPHAQTYLNPVTLLVSQNTTSAAEIFTLMMRELPHVSLMGTSTQGAMSDVLQKKLPNGFSIWLSNEFYLTPAGEWFEDTGIPVAHEIPYATLEDRTNNEDPGLETAYAFLTQ